MKMLIIYIFMRWAEPLQEKLVRDSLKAMKADVRFLPIKTMLEDIEALYLDWQTLASEAASGDRNKIDDKNIKRKETMDKLYAIAMEVNLMCKGTDINLAKASGLPMKADPVPVEEIEKPVIGEILRTANSGVVVVNWSKRRGVINYIVESSVDGGVTWVKGAYCKRVSKKLGGFTPGVLVSFRVKAIGAFTESDWSDTKSIMMA